MQQAILLQWNKSIYLYKNLLAISHKKSSVNGQESFKIIRVIQQWRNFKVLKFDVILTVHRR